MNNNPQAYTTVSAATSGDVVKAIPVWTEVEIIDAFGDYLATIKFSEDNAWQGLSAGEVTALNEWHKNIFMRELAKVK